MHEIAATAKEIYQVYSASCAGNTGLIETRVILSAEYLNYYKGRTEIWSLAPDCPVAIRDIEVLQDFSACMAVENILSIEIILQGSSEVQLGNHCLHNDGMPRIYLTSHGPSSTKKRVHKAGDKYRSIGIWASPRFFLETFGVDVDNLPESIQSVLINPDSGVLTLPLTASIKQTADDVFNMSYEGLRAEQYLKAKFTELLCLIAELASAPATKTAGDIALPRHKSNTLKTLMEALEQSHFLSLSLGEIATELGLCKNTLSSIFKEGYGMKLSDYFLQRRMELARKLLRERKRSVLEVALEVGYNNQSSFGRAYRQYYNCTPNQDRRATN
jgi:AraC-like DNA-binding protein